MQEPAKRFNKIMERTNILREFFSSKSDANKFLDAAQQDGLETDFQNYMTNGKGESNALDFVNEMCEQSLYPELFESWEKVKTELKERRRLLNKLRLPCGHQIGDYVVAIFPPHALLNCKVEAVKFKRNGSVYYDLSVEMKRPEWSKPQFAKLTEIHWSFVCKQGEENNNRTFDLAQENEKCLPPSRKPTFIELQQILNKMDFYKSTSGFIAPVLGGELTFFEEEPRFGATPITREEVINMIDQA